MCMLLLIGSRALAHHIEINRKMIDYDFIGRYDDFVNLYNAISKKEKVVESRPINSGKTWLIKTDKNIYECELVWDSTNNFNLYNLTTSDANAKIEKIHGVDVIIGSLDVLYMLKMSHRYKRNSPHFIKTMNDIHLMREHVDIDVVEYYKDAYVERMRDTYDYGHPKLNVNKKDFFTDSVEYTYDHDTIHNAVKHLEKPAYEYYKEDAAEVNCSKNLFFEVSEKIRLLGVLEESYVLALERHQIPNDFQPTPKESFDIALIKVCTSITSGWFREYAWENYHVVKKLFSDSYVDNFLSALNNGKIKPFDSNQQMM